MPNRADPILWGGGRGNSDLQGEGGEEGIREEQRRGAGPSTPAGRPAGAKTKPLGCELNATLALAQDISSGVL